MLFNSTDHAFAQAVSKIAFTNPFLPERIEIEKAALGDAFDPTTRPFWSWTLDDEHDRPNVVHLNRRVQNLIISTRDKIAAGCSIDDQEFELYDDLAWYTIYYTHFFDRMIKPVKEADQAAEWDRFLESFEHWMNIDGRKAPSYRQPAHLYACLDQLNRAFFNIFHCVIGRSWPIARLRARIFQSIFTHDLRRSRRSLYQHMNEITTLIVGATGTGKELVARAVGLSQYMPFDAKKKCFASRNDERFFALNLSAFSPTLIESELFGHQKGAFTGAADNRAGWLEAAGRYGTVFLDEIGELDLAIQVKLLRVLQNRQFQRTGENKTRRFEGKFIAATNRDLRGGIDSGEFREDFYYRLCSDIIETPTLLEQLEDSPAEFEFLVDFICHRVAAGDRESIKNDVIKWRTEANLENYAWPGNMRELEQCVRNVMIHNEYRPCAEPDHRDQSSLPLDSKFDPALLSRLANAELTADELLAHYCQVAYEKHGTYERAAAALGIDRRTVRAKAKQVK